MIASSVDDIGLSAFLDLWEAKWYGRHLHGLSVSAPLGTPSSAGPALTASANTSAYSPSSSSNRQAHQGTPNGFLGRSSSDPNLASYQSAGLLDAMLPSLNDVREHEAAVDPSFAQPSTSAPNQTRTVSGVSLRDDLSQSMVQHSAAQLGKDERMHGGALSGRTSDPHGVPVLGTWANRQYRLLDSVKERDLSEGSSEPAGSSNTSSLPMTSAFAQQAYLFAPDAAMQPLQLPRLPHSDNIPVNRKQVEDAAQEAAWRWRFARRWHAEQARVIDPANASGGDRMDEALAYLQAVGPHGCNMQHQRSGMSRENSLAAANTLSNCSVLAGVELLLGDDSWSGARTLERRDSSSADMLAATREVASLNRRAWEVLQQQVQVEQLATQRIENMHQTGPPWPGTYMQTVEVDEWGSFRFLLLKLKDNKDRQKIILRGRNYCTEGQLVEECNRKVVAVCAKHGVPMATVQVMGGGVAEWRRDRDRHLNLHSGFVSDPILSGTARSADLLNLASALARQHFPMNYRVTVT